VESLLGIYATPGGMYAVWFDLHAKLKSYKTLGLNPS
jgi:hypothetical protein